MPAPVDRARAVKFLVLAPLVTIVVIWALWSWATD